MDIGDVHTTHHHHHHVSPAHALSKMEDDSTAFSTLLERIGIDELPDRIDTKLRQTSGQRKLREFALVEFSRQRKMGLHAGIEVNSGGVDGYSVGGGYSAVIDWRIISKQQLWSLVKAVDQAPTDEPLRGPTMPHLEPVSGATALRVAQCRYGGGGGGGVTAFKLSEPRKRHRLQEAIGTSDHVAQRSILGCAPGRYDPTDACRSRAHGVVLDVGEGPGDAYGRLLRERVKTGALLDTSPRWQVPPVVRPSFFDAKTALHDGFGRREQFRDRVPTGPSPGSYDIPSGFDRPRPALARSMGVPLTRGRDGATWVPASFVMSASVRSPMSSPRGAGHGMATPRRKVTVLGVATANAELRK